jgi:hypothetical protein
MPLHHSYNTFLNSYSAYLLTNCFTPALRPAPVNPSVIGASLILRLVAMLLRTVQHCVSLVNRHDDCDYWYHRPSFLQFYHCQPWNTELSSILLYVRFEVSTAVTMMIIIFWEMIIINPLIRFRRTNLLLNLFRKKLLANDGRLVLWRSCSSLNLCRPVRLPDFKSRLNESADELIQESQDNLQLRSLRLNRVVFKFIRCRS